MNASPPTRQPPPDQAAGTLRGVPFRITRMILWSLAWLLVGLRVEGVHHVPRHGAVLVACNHLHNADPFLISFAIPRPVHFMAKRELYRIRPVGWLLRVLGAFPVDRGKADRAAIRRAEATLAQGIAVGMFPEGTRSVTAALQPAFPGAALIAWRGGVPVLPVVITGSERLPLNGAKSRSPARAGRGPGRRVLVRIGPPFDLPRERDGRRLSAEEGTALLMTELARLLPDAYRGVYRDSVTNA